MIYEINLKLFTIAYLKKNTAIFLAFIDQKREAGSFWKAEQEAEKAFRRRREEEEAAFNAASKRRIAEEEAEQAAGQRKNEEEVGRSVGVANFPSPYWVT